MKYFVEKLVESAITQLKQDEVIPPTLPVTATIERTRDARHGDFASNIALTLAKALGKKPRELAERFVAALPAAPQIAKVEIAGPGFINFYIEAAAYSGVITEILAAQDRYGRSDHGNGISIHIEYVSANPTGPLHVGHGRGAAYGAVVANLLAALGYKVHREYYINDAGRQMDILAASVWLRYLQRCGETFAFPTNGYKGEYVYAIADKLLENHGQVFFRSAPQVLKDLPPDEPQGGDKEIYIDAVIAKAKELLGLQQYGEIFDLGLGVILEDIRQDLEEFGVTYDEWFSERSLTENGAVDRALERLRTSGHVYEKEGALWFKSTDYGDEKDRVLVRENGQKTYFASDIAYHLSKLERGYDRIIDVWGADHHGYIPRVKSALAAMGDDPERLAVLLVQFAVLYRGGEKVQMSTRSGEFVTLRDLRHDVGNDAARFFYVMRKSEQHMDFDLDLAKSQSNDNPVFYIQYAHARVCSVLRQLGEKSGEWHSEQGSANLHLLQETHELALMRNLSRYPEIVAAAAINYEPHQLAHYLHDLANDFHTYYNAHTFLVENDALRNARLNLIVAARQVIRNGLTLLGVSAAEKM